MNSSNSQSPPWKLGAWRAKKLSLFNFLSVEYIISNARITDAWKRSFPFVKSARRNKRLKKGKGELGSMIKVIGIDPGNWGGHLKNRDDWWRHEDSRFDFLSYRSPVWFLLSQPRFFSERHNTRYLFDRQAQGQWKTEQPVEICGTLKRAERSTSAF